MTDPCTFDNSARSASAAQCGLVELLDLRERLAQPNHDAWNTTIANDKVGAEPERHHGYIRVKIAEEGNQVILVRGLEQIFGSSAALEPDERRERSVGSQLASDLRQSGDAHFFALF